MRIKKIILLITVMFFLMAACNGAFAAEKKGVLVSFWERIKAKWSAKKEAEPAKEAPVVQERLKPVAPVTEVTPPEEIKTAAPMTTASKDEVEVKVKEEVREEAEKGMPEFEEMEEFEEIGEFEEVEESGAEEAAEGEKKKREIPYSKEEMIEVIKRRLTTFQQVLYMVPGLSMKKDDKGEAEYFYESQTEPGSKPVSLAELDKDTVYKIFARVNNEATRLQTERLMQQLQQQENLMRTIQQQQNIQRQQQIIQQQQQLNQQRAQQQQQPPPAPPQNRR